MIGGQALMEGVMMRGKSAMAMAVRAPDGSIMLETTRLKKPAWYNKVPIVRGVVTFVVSLVSGMSTLLKSAEVSTPDEETPGKGWMALAVILGVLFAVGLFIALPRLLSWVLFDLLLDWRHALVVNLAEGAIRIFIFILYLFIVSRMKDIRRTFMYHGAEHRTINCFEKGLDMTVENVQSCSTRHNRCGTTFLFFVMVVSILVFSLVSWLLNYLGWTNFFVTLAARIAFLPLVAGLSYELLRGLAKLPDNAFVNVLRAPGLALQRLTTYPPEDDMAEVAIKSFLAVYNMDADASIAPVKFGEYRLSAEREAARIMLMNEAKLSAREAEAETDWMLCDILQVRRPDLNNVRTLNLGQHRKLFDMLDRRVKGEPLDYILGYGEFYGLRVKVTPDVLIPRMETELLVSLALGDIGEKKARVLDMCTGSGCVALAIAKNSSAQVVAADISDKALAVAGGNLDGVELVQSDMFSKIEGQFDLIVCNPPYIREGDLETLAAEVRCQPHLALLGGESGLDFYGVLAAGAAAHLAAGGALMAEIGCDQAEQVSEIFARAGLKDIAVHKDLDGNDRVVTARLQLRRTAETAESEKTEVNGA